MFSGPQSRFSKAKLDPHLTPRGEDPPPVRIPLGTPRRGPRPDGCEVPIDADEIADALLTLREKANDDC